MKRLLFLLTLFLAVSQLKAQRESFTEVRAGLLYVDKDEIGESVGFRLSLARNIAKGKFWSLQPEVGFSQYRIETGILGAQRAVQFRTIDIMPSIKFYPLRGLHIYTGPQLSYFASIDHITKTAEVEIEAVEDFFNFMDFGFNVGFGYELKNALSFSVNYYYGLSNIRDNNSSAEYNTNYVGLLVGLSF